MNVPYYTEEQIRQARSIDLMTYLQACEPSELVHFSGDTFCTKTHMSLFHTMKVTEKEMLIIYVPVPIAEAAHNPCCHLQHPVRSVQAHHRYK